MIIRNFFRLKIYFISSKSTLMLKAFIKFHISPQILEEAFENQYFFQLNWKLDSFTKNRI